jgi:hypothetical protein
MGAPLGTSVLITGSVTDQSSGETCLGIPAAGTPAISDEDMTSWMEYMYMQQEKPTDAKGVTVKLTSIDPNGNYQDLGEVTTDIWGNFGKSWIPPVPGEYVIMAEFEGSASYGSSAASTYIVVDEAPVAAQPIEPEPAAPAPTEPTPSTVEQTEAEPVMPVATETTITETTETQFITTETAILAAVAVACVIGVVSFLALRKRK